MEDIKKIFLNGMDKAALNSKYCDNIEEEISRIGIDDINGAEMDEILKHFDDLNKGLREKMYKEKAEEIFKCIPMKMELFYDKFEECMDVPIFKYYDAYQMFQRIACASNEDLVTIKEILVDRAKKHTKELEPELNTIKRLRQVLEDYCRGKNIGIKIVMLKEFSNDLGSIIDLYNPVFKEENKEIYEGDF